MVGGNQPSLEIEGPQIPEHPWEPHYPEEDNSDSDQLNLHFQTLRIPLGPNILSLTDRPGHLRLYGAESLTSKFTQAFVARRWRALQLRGRDQGGVRAGDLQQAAGLAC